MHSYHPWRNNGIRLYRYARFLLQPLAILGYDILWYRTPKFPFNLINNAAFAVWSFHRSLSLVSYFKHPSQHSQRE